MMPGEGRWVSDWRRDVVVFDGCGDGWTLEDCLDWRLPEFFELGGHPVHLFHAWPSCFRSKRLLSPIVVAQTSCRLSFAKSCVQRGGCVFTRLYAALLFRLILRLGLA